jgi:hypothetical protein
VSISVDVESKDPGEILVLEPCVPKTQSRQFGASLLLENASFPDSYCTTANLLRAVSALRVTSGCGRDLRTFPVRGGGDLEGVMRGGIFGEYRPGIDCTGGLCIVGLGILRGFYSQSTIRPPSGSGYF